MPSFLTTCTATSEEFAGQISQGMGEMIFFALDPTVPQTTPILPSFPLPDATQSTRKRLNDGIDKDQAVSAPRICLVTFTTMLRTHTDSSIGALTAWENTIGSDARAPVFVSLGIVKTSECTQAEVFTRR